MTGLQTPKMAINPNTNSIDWPDSAIEEFGSDSSRTSRCYWDHSSAEVFRLLRSPRLPRNQFAE